MAAEKLISPGEKWFDSFKAVFEPWMNVSALAPYLFEEGLLTNDEFERILIVMDNYSQQDRVGYTISVLKRKGPQAFMKFIAALTRSVEESTPCDMGNKYLLNDVLAKVQVPVMVALNKLPGVAKMCAKEEITTASNMIDDVIKMVKSLEEKVKELENKLAAPPPTLQCVIM